MITGLHDEPDALLVLKIILQHQVHEIFQRVTRLGCDTLVLGHAPVVSAVARDNQLHILGRVLQNELDAAYDQRVRLVDGVGGRKGVSLGQIFVNAARNEVAQQREYNRLDRGIAAGNLPPR